MTEDPPRTLCALCASYSDRIQELEKTLVSLHQDNRAHIEAIGDLKQNLVTLTGENMHLRGKLTNFNSGQELSLALGQTKKLINSCRVESPTINLRFSLQTEGSHKSLFSDIDDIKTQFAQKKREYDTEMKHYTRKIESEFRHLRTSSNPLFLLCGDSGETAISSTAASLKSRIAKNHTGRTTMKHSAKFLSLLGNPLSP